MHERRLEEYLETNDLESVWFARPNSFAWVTGGNNIVDRDAETGVAAAGYDGDELVVVTDTIEGQRLRDEELPEDMPVIEEPWYDATLGEIVAEYAETPAAADFAVPAEAFEQVDPTPLRQPLTEPEIEAYRGLGRDTAASIEQVVHELRPEDTEHEAAAALRIALSTRGIDAPVVLVGGSTRAQQYRHFTPRRDELGSYALLSVTARRDGLYASCTRTVAFDPPEWLEERHEAAARVEATALASTRSHGRTGGTAGDVFADIQDAYATLGYDEEWQQHHQGGAAGFAGREWIARPDSDEPVRSPMAYAWNPTIQGTKSEDTILVTEDGYEILTETGSWPTRSVDAVDYDESIERHWILEQEG
jgi:Xaa-Pro aminopeptidase